MTITDYEDCLIIHKHFDLNTTERNLEILTIRRFIAKEKIERYVAFVSKGKTRRKFIAKLAHFADLDYAKFKNTDKDPEIRIFEISKKLALNVCYVISENRKIDSRYLKIDEAVREVIGYGMGSLLVFGSAQALYYEGEGPNDRYISNV